MRKVLVTGITGFLGHKIALHFLNNGYEVIGWSRREYDTFFPIYINDLLDIDVVSRALESETPDIIIHCAGNADVGKSVKNPRMDFNSSVLPTQTLLFSMHRLGLRNTRFVFISSAGVYGNPKSLPITEEMTFNPLSPYAVHKVMCEELCRYFIRNYNMDIKIARIFSAYGAGLRKQIFWDMYNKSKYGTLPMFGTGKESRDYIHVDDVARAIYLLATAKTDDTIFNIANGKEITIREVAEIFAKYAGINKTKISFNGMVREGDPLNWCANISRIRKLGYHSCVDIELGIRDYVEWLNKLVD